jgi:hypothetical protein
MDRRIRLSEIVAAVTDAFGHGLTAPEAARAREAIARAGWVGGYTSWEELLELIGDEKYPAPGLRHVIDDYGA